MKRSPIFSMCPVILALSLIICSGCQPENAGSQDKAHELDPFLITKQELILEYSHAPGERRLSFGKTQLSPGRDPTGLPLWPISAVRLQW